MCVNFVSKRKIDQQWCKLLFLTFRKVKNKKSWSSSKSSLSVPNWIPSKPPDTITPKAPLGLITLLALIDCRFFFSNLSIKRFLLDRLFDSVPKKSIIRADQLDLFEAQKVDTHIGLIIHRFVRIFLSCRSIGFRQPLRIHTPDNRMLLTHWIVVWMVVCLVDTAAVFNSVKQISALSCVQWIIRSIRPKVWYYQYDQYHSTLHRFAR